MKKKHFDVVINFYSISVKVEATDSGEAEEIALAQIENDSSIYFDLEKEISSVQELDADGKPIDFGEEA